MSIMLTYENFIKLYIIAVYFIPFKSLRSVWFFFLEINNFIQQGSIKLISDSKDIYNVIEEFYF